MKTIPAAIIFTSLLLAPPLFAQEKAPLPPAALEALKAYDRDAGAARERAARTLQAIIADQTARGKLDVALAVKELLANLPTVSSAQSAVAGAAAATATGATPGAAGGRLIIQANEKLGADLGSVVKGTRLTIQYIDGKWAFNGVADPAKWTSPDEAQAGTGASVGLFSVEDGEPKVIASVPAGTKRRPFHFKAEKDYPKVVLRIMDSDVVDNHGSSTYSVSR
jgi:hypothetical protein